MLSIFFADKLNFKYQVLPMDRRGVEYLSAVKYPVKLKEKLLDFSKARFLHMGVYQGRHTSTLPNYDRHMTHSEPPLTCCQTL